MNLTVEQYEDTENVGIGILITILILYLIKISIIYTIIICIKYKKNNINENNLEENKIIQYENKKIDMSYFNKDLKRIYCTHCGYKSPIHDNLTYCDICNRPFDLKPKECIINMVQLEKNIVPPPIKILSPKKRKIDF
jgi:hypothetical protein